MHALCGACVYPSESAIDSDAPETPSALPDNNLRYQAVDWRTLNGQKDYAAPFFCPRSFDLAVMIAQWYDLVRLDGRVRTLPVPQAQCHWSRDYPPPWRS